MLVAFATWMGFCVFVANYLQGTKAYGAMLSGYTVAIIAINNIDAPQSVFESGIARSPRSCSASCRSPSSTMRWARLMSSRTSAPAWPRPATRCATSSAGPCATAIRPRRTPPTRCASAAPRDAIGVVATEFHDGENRAAGARSAVAALFAAVAAARSFALAVARSGDPDDLRARVLAGLDGDRDALPDLVARLDALAASGAADPDAVLRHRRAIDLLRQDRLAEDGIAALETGRAPMRDMRLPVHRDFPDALRNAARVVITVAISAALFVLSGWPATSAALLQVSAFAALASINPNPIGFATGALWGMPLAALCAGIVEFILLDGGQGFPLLAIAMAPVIVTACLLSLRPPTASLGFILLVFFPVVLSPANPQPYNPEAYINASVLFCVAGLILFLVIRIVLPTTHAQRRRWSLRAARADVIEALSGEPQEADERVNLDADRVVQFAGWAGTAGASRRAALRHAFALAALDTAAAGAQAGLNRLAGMPAYDGAVRQARSALRRAEAGPLREAGTALLAAARDAPAESRRIATRVVADLATASYVVEGQGRVLRRLDLWGTR